MTASAASGSEMDSEGLAIGLRILADLLESGLPLIRALGALAELAPSAWQPGIPALIECVREGSTLSRALQSSATGVPPLVIGIVRAGEGAGHLPSAIRRAAQHAEQMDARRKALRAAFAYPLIVAVVGLGSIGMIVGVVLPRFAGILADIGQELPRSTRLVLGVGSIARGAFVPTIVGSIVGATWWHSVRRSPEGRRSLDRALLALPVIGALRLSAATARICSSLGVLLEAGVPLRQAIAHAGESVGDAVLRERLARTSDRIAAGDRLGRAMRDESAATSLACRLIAAGEESGRLASMLTYAARLEQDRTERLVRQAVRVVEPTMLLALASVVGLVAAALFQAVYAVRPT